MKPRRRNPLRPGAYEHDPSPTALPGFDDRAGVHMTPNENIALWYAMVKACNTRVRGKRTNNTGVIFTFDVKGLDPKPDYDAKVEQKHTGFLLDENVAWLVTKEFEMGPNSRRDQEHIAKILQREAEDQSEQSDTALESRVLDAIIRQPGVKPHNAGELLFGYLAGLAETAAGAREIIEACYARENDKADWPLVWFAHAIQQWRFFVDIDTDRLLQIRIIKPFEDKVSESEEREEGSDDTPTVYNFENVADGLTIDAFDSLKIDISKRRARNVMYHGTDLWRARQIFPELKHLLVSPWPFMMASDNYAHKVVDDKNDPTSMLQLTLPGA